MTPLNDPACAFSSRKANGFVGTHLIANKKCKNCTISGMAWLWWYFVNHALRIGSAMTLPIVPSR